MFKKFMNDIRRINAVEQQSVSFKPLNVVHDTSLVLSFKNFINDHKVKRVFRLGSDVVNSIHPFLEKPNVINGFRAAFLIGKSFVDELELWSHDFFEQDDKWTEPFPRDFNGAILKIVKSFPHQMMKTAVEHTYIYVVTLNSGKIGWIANTRFSAVKIDRIYAETPNIDAIKQEIKHLLWEQYKGKPLVLRKNNFSVRSFEEDKVVLEVDDVIKSLSSARASDYAVYIKKAFKEGINRSVMLYGPPGTGKSTLARTLVDKLQLRSFRIRISDIDHIDNNTLFEALEIFHPDAIILDDFDRVGNQVQLLETLEHFQRHVKLVIATVNNKNQLDPALLRPGRFDELIYVKTLDDEVIKTVLGPENLDVFDIVKEWPIVFVQELVKRRKYMSKDDALNSISELALRVEEMIHGDNEEENQIHKKIVKQKNKRTSNNVELSSILSGNDEET